MSVIRAYIMVCPECDFTTRDQKLMDNHNCDIAQFGGSCEDYPACGHEYGDCNGLLYGSDEAIKEQVYREMDMEDFWDGAVAADFECDDEDCETLGSCIC